MFKNRQEENRYKKLLQDYMKVARSGSKHYVYGAPEDLTGPYDTSKEAQRVHDRIIDEFEDYEIVGKRVVRKN